MTQAEQISQAIATVERQISEAKSDTAKKVLGQKLERLKEDLKKAKPSLSTLPKARKTVKALNKSSFQELVEKLSKKPEYAFLKDYSQERFLRDKARTAKPKGYRFKGDNDNIPTADQVKKGLKDGTVYYEGRPIRSDISREIRLEKGGSIASFNWNNFTLKELNEALPADVEITYFNTPEKKFNRPYFENKKLFTTKRLTISQHGEAEVSKGNENIYLEIKCYNAEDKNDMSEYEVSIYTKENHSGLKEVAKSLIEKMKLGGSVKTDLKALWDKTVELAKKGYDKTKEVSKKKIHDGKKAIAIDVINETKGKVGKTDKSELNKAKSIIVKKFADGGTVKFRKLAKSNNFDIVVPEGRYEVELDANNKVKSIVHPSGTRHKASECPIYQKYKKEINEYLTERFENGGRIDLFEDYENIPPRVQGILDEYSEDFEDGNYEGMGKALEEVEAEGYTFDFYVDGSAYGLRPKGVKLSELQGYEDVDEDSSAFEKGGGVGSTDVQIQGFKRNIMGTLSFDLKLSNMRKFQDFIVYPISKGDDNIMIQSSTRIGRIYMETGIGKMSQSHSNGAYGVHLAMDKLIPFQLSSEQLEELKEKLRATAGDKVGSRGIVSDNSGADQFAEGGGVGEKYRIQFYIDGDIDWTKGRYGKLIDTVYFNQIPSDVELSEIMKSKNSKYANIDEYELRTKAYTKWAGYSKGKNIVKYAKGGGVKGLKHKYYQTYVNLNKGFDLIYFDDSSDIIGDYKGTYETIELAKEQAKKDGYTSMPIYNRYAEGGNIDSSYLGTTRIGKGHYGWTAKTTTKKQINGYDWEITTMKRSSGDLVSSANGGKAEQKEGYSTFMYSPFEDPSLRLISTRPKMVNEKAVTKQHEEALKIFIEKLNEMKSDKMATGGKVGEKVYNVMHNVGKAKYVVNFYDGVKTHSDGSRFFDIEIFKNLKGLKEFTKKLDSEGYKKQMKYGGSLNSEDTNIMIYAQTLSYKTGLQASAIKEFTHENNLSDAELLNIVQGIGTKKLSVSDLVTAVSGKKANKSAKEVIAFAKSDEAFKKMATGGKLESEYIVSLQDPDSGEIEKVNVMATSKEDAENVAVEQSGYEGWEIAGVNKMAKGGGVDLGFNFNIVYEKPNSDIAYTHTINANSMNEAEKKFYAKHPTCKILSIREEYAKKDGHYAKGGSIPDNYEGRTPEDIWNSLSKRQRQHFLYDHLSEIEAYKNIGELPSSEIIKAYNSEWSTLDKDIKNRFTNHTREGQYAKGGSIKASDKKFKEVEDLGIEQYYTRYFGTFDTEKGEIELVVVAKITDLEEYVSEDELPAEGNFQLSFDIVPKEEYISEDLLEQANDENSSVSGDSVINIVNYMGGLRYEPSEKVHFKTHEKALKHLMSIPLNKEINRNGEYPDNVIYSYYNRAGKTNEMLLDYLIGASDKFFKNGGNVGKAKKNKYLYIPNQDISKIVLKSKQVIGKDRILDGAYVKNSKKAVKFTEKYKFPIGSVVWDKTHKRYGVVLNNFGNEFEGDGGEIRLDSDGVQPIFQYDKNYDRTEKYNLVPYGSKEDKGNGDLSDIKQSGQRLIDSRKEKGDEEYVKYYQDAYGDVIAGKIDGKPFKNKAEINYNEFLSGATDKYRREGYSLIEAIDTAFRDLGLETGGEFDKKELDEVIASNENIKKAWKDYKKNSSIEIVNGKYRNPYQYNVYATGGSVSNYYNDMSEEEILKQTVVYDNGGKTLDRYTVFTPDGSVFGMSESPTRASNGFNQYVGDESEIEKGKHLGKLLKKVPTGIKLAVLNRMKEEFGDGGSMYATGGSMESKKVYVYTGYNATATKDDYEEGELETVGDWDINEGKTFTSKKELIDYINENIIYSDYEETDFDWESGEGRNVQTDVLCSYDDFNGYYPASESEKALWKKGKKTLYNVHYWIDVMPVIPTEFKRGGNTNEDLSGNYFSSTDFVETHDLESLAKETFGDDWEEGGDYDYDIEEIRLLIKALGGGYKVLYFDNENRDKFEEAKSKYFPLILNKSNDGDLFVIPTTPKKARGGNTNYSYIENDKIDRIITNSGKEYGSNVILDGAYVTDKVRTPKMSRTQFEDETYSFGEGGNINFNKHIWEGWTVGNFIQDLEPMFNQIMSGGSWQKPFTTKQQVKEWCMDNQPYYKKHVPEVVNYFWAKVEGKYAKGGGVDNFPPKGELKNKNNFLLKYEKRGMDYEFYIYKPEKKDVSSYEQIKYVCVNKDCPTRMSYNQFINYLYAESYLDDRQYAKGGGVGDYFYDTRKDKNFQVIMEDGDKMAIQYMDRSKSPLGKAETISKNEFEYYVQMGAWNKWKQEYATGGEITPEERQAGLKNYPKLNF